MSRISLALSVACVAMATWSAAQAAPNTEQVQILGHGAHALSSGEFDALRGDYDLAGGGRLSLGGTRLHPVAELDGQGPVALVMTGPNQFTDVGGHMRVDVRAAANGSVSGVAVTFTPRLL